MKIFVALVLAVFLLATVFAAGCTTNTTQNTATPIPSGGQSTGDDKSSYLTSAFGKNYDIVSPFKKTTNSAGDVVYSGTIIDKADKLNPYQREITIELTKDRNTTKARYAAIKDGLVKQGYVQNMDYSTYWYGIYGGRGIADLYDQAQKRVFISIQEPGSMGIGTGNELYTYSLGVYNVIVSNETKAP